MSSINKTTNMFGTSTKRVVLLLKQIPDVFAEFRNENSDCSRMGGSWLLKQHYLLSLTSTLIKGLKQSHKNIRIELKKYSLLNKEIKKLENYEDSIEDSFFSDENSPRKGIYHSTKKGFLAVEKDYNNKTRQTKKKHPKVPTKEKTEKSKKKSLRTQEKTWKEEEKYITYVSCIIPTKKVGILQLKPFNPPKPLHSIPVVFSNEENEEFFSQFKEPTKELYIKIASTLSVPTSDKHEPHVHQKSRNLKKISFTNNKKLRRSIEKILRKKPLDLRHKRKSMRQEPSPLTNIFDQRDEYVIRKQTKLTIMDPSYD
jgi:hypothetical protein